MVLQLVDTLLATKVVSMVEMKAVKKELMKVD
jgi:hypothetical protein